METATQTNTKWVVDNAHSELLFRVKHLMITHVKGEFRKFSAEVITEGSTLENALVKATVETSSIFTNNDDRDAHLRSADFFDCEKFPVMTFEGKAYKTSSDAYEIKGKLTIKDVTKEVVLHTEFGGINKDPWGNEKAGFSFTAKINRKDWGLTWNAVLESGGVLVSDEVKLLGEIQLIKA
ncbi:YceI family protein [Thermaurantimonas aggregans]|uniref:YceI family protein n=1 Tax=Thermaurantimonas aggregans TaxID=2173829 RepID=UPI0023F29E42|nr:YceI family protein [Thermaurantimonas aggregans]MCX8148382.1 YceI family protein [Thermaurantimonas aggregans]